MLPPAAAIEGQDSSRLDLCSMMKEGALTHPARTVAQDGYQGLSVRVGDSRLSGVAGMLTSWASQSPVSPASLPEHFLSLLSSGSCSRMRGLPGL